MGREAFKREAGKEILLLLVRDKRKHRLAECGAVHRAPHADLRDQPEGVAALHHVQIENLAAVQHCEIYRFAGNPP